VSLNLSHVFVRYPDVKGVGQALEPWLAARLKSQSDLPRHVCVPTGSPWIGVFATGNASPVELAEHLSRALEAHALWFGLSGRALAYRFRRLQHGRTLDDTLVPPELFARDDVFRLPPYPDAEEELALRLRKEGVPDAYVFAMAEEFGASARGEPDAVVVAPAPWSESGLQQEPFAHRMPKRPPGTRTLFERFDEEKTTVADSVVLRGTFDEERARALLFTLQRMTLRRTVQPGWTVRYELESPQGPALLEPVAALYAKERGPKRLSYELA